MVDLQRVRRCAWAALGAGVCVLAESAAAGPPTLAPGGFVVIAENVHHDGSWHTFYVPAGGGTALALGTATFGPDADLPPSIRSSWFNDRLEIVVSNGSQMVAFAPFGAGGSEDIGAWPGDGTPNVSVSAFDDSLVGFEVPVFAFQEPIVGYEDPIIGRRVALWETSWVGFVEPIIAFEVPVFLPVTFEVPVFQVRPDRLQVVDMMDDAASPIVVPGTEGLGTIVAATAFPPGSVATDLQPAVPGQPALAFITGDGGGAWSLYGIWGTNGTAFGGVTGESYGGVDGEAIWGTNGTAIPISQNGLMVNPTALMAFPGSEWLGTSFSLVVLDGGTPARVTPQLIGVRPNGDQDVITSGDLFVNPMDMALAADGTIIVADPEASSGSGAIIGVDPLTGAQSVLVQGGLDAGMRRPIAVSVVRCAPPTFQVTTTSDFVDPTPGDGDPSDGLGNVCLRSAIMEANASPCSGGMIIEVPAGTWPIGIGGTNEDAGATGDFDITGYVRIRGRGPGVTIIDGRQVDRIFDVRPGATLILANLTLFNGNTTVGGGGVRAEGLVIATNVEITGCTTSGGGGGLRADAEALIVGSTIASNSTGGNAGGISALNGADALMARSLIAENDSAFNGGGVATGGVGTMLTMVNTTLSGNIARFRGGGLFADNSSSIMIDHATIVDNIADSEGTAGVTGGGVANNGSSVAMANTIMAGNRAGATVPQNASGTIDTPGYLLLDDASGFTLTGNTGTVIVAEPMINALADNGGPTMTHSVSSQSPAVDGADPADTTIDDQRSMLRPSDGDGDNVARSDIGAYEFVPPTCPGDINGDGNTDVFDFGIMATNFGATVPFNTNGDLDGDGVVTVFDFAILAAAFGCTS